MARDQVPDLSLSQHNQHLSPTRVRDRPDFAFLGIFCLEFKLDTSSLPSILLQLRSSSIDISIDNTTPQIIRFFRMGKNVEPDP
jgi:hypothetical protein